MPNVRDKGALLSTIHQKSGDLTLDCKNAFAGNIESYLDWTEDGRFIMAEYPYCFFAYDLEQRRFLYRKEDLDTR